MMEIEASEGAEQAQLHFSLPHFSPFLPFSLPSPLLWAGPSGPKPAETQGQILLLIEPTENSHFYGSGSSF